MTGDFRHRIRDTTASLHEALHQDKTLSTLLSPSLTRTEYRSSLRLFWHFYAALEKQRAAQGHWHSLNLAAEVTALSADLSDHASRPIPPPRFDGAYALLGGLYVGHGAAFGRNSMRMNVMRALPDLPHHFMSRRCNPTQWQSLLGEIERAGKMPEHASLVEKGALQAFEFMSCLAREPGALLAA